MGERTGGGSVADIKMARSHLSLSSRQQWHTALAPLLTLSVLSLLLLLILASCGTTLSRNGAAGQGSRSSAGRVATQTPVGVACTPSSEGAAPRCSPCSPEQGQQPAQLPCSPCPPAPPTAPPTCFPCPPEQAIPCPIVPPQPTPRLGQPVIAFCPTPPTTVKGAPGTIQVQSIVCGRDFHPLELVTLTASGRLGRLEWQQRADQMGAFVSPLPPLLCRNAPLTLIASGNQGSRSNSLTLDAEACPPTV
jgi:hypothetical protein